MAKRISQLSQLTSQQVSSLDILPIVDVSSGQTKYITVSDLTGLPDVGWIATGEAWSYSSYSSILHTGVITVPSDATIKYSKGMWVRFVQATGGTKWGRIIALTSTSLTVDLKDGQTLVNEAITSPVYSPLKAPFGSPTEDEMTHSQTNAGSAGGTIFFRNNNGVKEVFGQTAQIFVSGAGVQASATSEITFPAGYFIAVRAVNNSTGIAINSQFILASTIDLSTVFLKVQVDQYSATNGGAAIHYVVRGI